VQVAHAEHQRGLGADRVLVVLDTRTVRRSDLAQTRAGAREHVGNPKPVPDLDQLAPRHEHLTSLRERGQCEHHGGGVVVDDERRFRPCQPAQERNDVALPRAACAAREVVLEVGIAARRVAHSREGLVGERRTAEVRVRDHACRVDHSP
jgi:hypothetical protein